MLKFEFSIDETNLVLAALSKFPFENVAGLIQKIQNQASEQLPKNEAQVKELKPKAKKAE